MHYTQKAMRDFAHRLSRELDLKFRTNKESYHYYFIE